MNGFHSENDSESDDVSESTDEDEEEARLNAQKEKERKMRKASKKQKEQPSSKKSSSSSSKKSKQPSKAAAKKKSKSTSKKRSRYDSDSSDDEVPVPKKAVKRKKDPNAPKKNISTFMLFTKNERATIKENNPDASFGEIAKLVAKEYKALTTEEMAEYHILASKDKERYLREMEDYDPPSDDEYAVATGKKKAKKDPNAPKKNLNSYTYFCQSNRPKILAEHPDAKFSEISKLQSADYKKLTPEDKKEFEGMAAKDKERYLEEMEVYKQKNKNSSSTSAKKKKKASPPKEEVVSSSEESSDTESSDDSSDSDSDSD